MSISSSLHRLQKIDTQIDQANNRLKEIEAALSQDAELQAAIQHQSQITETFAQETRQLRKAEEAVTAQRIKIGQSESALYGGKVRNPKELQDLQNEVAALKRYLATLEDQQLELMLQSEDLNASLEQAQAQVNDIHAHLIEKNAHLKGEQSEILQQLQRLEVEHAAVQNAIPAEPLALYQHLRQQRRGIAVASVQGKACAACGAMLTPAQIQSAQAPTQIVRCPSCSRILYPG